MDCNINGSQDVDIGVGETGDNCNFRIGTPDDLGSDWEVALLS